MNSSCTESTSNQRPLELTCYLWCYSNCHYSLTLHFSYSWKIFQPKDYTSADRLLTETCNKCLIMLHCFKALHFHSAMLEHETVTHDFATNFTAPGWFTGTYPNPRLSVGFWPSLSSASAIPWTLEPSPCPSSHPCCVITFRPTPYTKTWWQNALNGLAGYKLNIL